MVVLDNLAVWLGQYGFTYKKSLLDRSTYMENMLANKLVTSLSMEIAPNLGFLNLFFLQLLHDLFSKFSSCGRGMFQHFRLQRSEHS